MKILIDARFYGLENAGLGRYTLNLLNYLQKLDKKNKYYILLREKYYNHLSLNNNFTKILAEIPHYSLKEQIQIPSIIQKINPDLAHFLHFNVPLKYNGKFIVTIHDMTMHNQSTLASNLSLPAYFAKHLVYRRVFAHAIRKSQKIIVPSQFVKDEILKKFNIKNDKLQVIYEGVSSKKYLSQSIKNNNWKKEAPYFLYVGNAYPHKNLEFVVRAIVDLNKTSPVNFLIVSKYNKFTQRLEKIVSKLNAQKYIKLLGFVPDENIYFLYENSVGFIYPSLSEGFGLPGLEAMNSGTLILASSIPTFKEIYGSHAIYFDPRNNNSLKDALYKALSLTVAERREAILENKKFVLRYSWEKMAIETLKVYNSN